MKKSALILFGKPSVAGSVNTRLCPPLSPQEAALLNSAFLQDAIHVSKAITADLQLFLAGPPATEDLVGVWIPQKGNDLSARMLNAFAQTFARGYERVLIMGTDVPTLPPEFLAYAFDELATRNTIVLGPSNDGGYCLLGMTDLHPTMFEGLSFGHSRVFEQAVEQATALDVNVSILPQWYDIDTVNDLKRLKDELSGLPLNVAPATRKVLSGLQF